MHEKGAFSTMFLEVLLAALSTTSSKVPFDGSLYNFSQRFGGFLWLPFLGVSVLAYPSWVVTHEIWLS